MTIVLYHPARILLLILLHLIEAHFKSHARSLSLSFLYFLFSLWLGSICFLRCARGCPGSVTARYTLKWICIKHKHIFLIPDVRALAARNHQSVAHLSLTKLIGRAANRPTSKPASRPSSSSSREFYIETRMQRRDSFPFVFFPGSAASLSFLGRTQRTRQS